MYGFEQQRNPIEGPARNLANDLNTGHAREAADLLRHEIQQHPQQAASIVLRAEQETQQNAPDKLLMTREGQVFIHDQQRGANYKIGQVQVPYTQFSGQNQPGQPGQWQNPGQDWQGQNLQQQRPAERLTADLRSGNVQDAAAVVRYELERDPQNAAAVIGRAQQDSQFNSRDRLVMNNGSVEIQDCNTNQTVTVGFLRNQPPSNYYDVNGSNNGALPYNWNQTNNGFNNQFASPAIYSPNPYQTQFNPAQAALDVTLGAVGGLALSSLFRGGQNYHQNYSSFQPSGMGRHWVHRV